MGYYPCTSARESTIPSRRRATEARGRTKAGGIGISPALLTAFAQMREYVARHPAQREARFPLCLCHRYDGPSRRVTTFARLRHRRAGTVHTPTQPTEARGRTKAGGIGISPALLTAFAQMREYVARHPAQREARFPLCLCHRYDGPSRRVTTFARLRHRRAGTVHTPTQPRSQVRGVGANRSTGRFSAGHALPSCPPLVRGRSALPASRRGMPGRQAALARGGSGRVV